MPQPIGNRRPPPSLPQTSPQARNRANIRRNWSKAEAYLTGVEKAHGLAKAWEFRQRLERGEVTLDDLTRR